MKQRIKLRKIRFIQSTDESEHHLIRRIKLRNFSFTQ